MLKSHVTALLALSALAALPACSGFGNNNAQTASAVPAATQPVASTMVQQVQTALQQQGYYKGNVDGIWGPETETAVRSYQQARNLTVNGQLDTQTLAALNVGANNGNMAANTTAAPNNANMAPNNGNMASNNADMGTNNAGTMPQNGQQASGAYTAGMQPGAMSHHEIRQVQTALQQQGLYRGNIDGIWGPQTEAAVQSYQQSHNLNASGQLDQRTLASLNIGTNGGNMATNGGNMPANGNMGATNGNMGNNGNMGSNGTMAPANNGSASNAAPNNVSTMPQNGQVANGTTTQPQSSAANSAANTTAQKPATSTQ